MNELIITSENKSRYNSREILFFVLGVLAGIFLLVYSILVIKNVRYVSFGIVILAAEIIIFFKSRAKYASFIAVYENGVKGCAVSKANSMITVEFELRFSSISSLKPNGDMLIVETDNGQYLCRSGALTDEIKNLILEKKSG